MHLTRRMERGWLVRCECPGQTEFRVRRLGIAVECPRCGRTALAPDLVTEYWTRSASRKASAARAALLAG
jgi:hypothetical protein